MLKRLIRPFTNRYRRYMQAEIMAELAAMRADRARLNEALDRLGDFQNTVSAVEKALVTLVLHKTDAS
jgi:hypothetical protein